MENSVRAWRYIYTILDTFNQINNILNTLTKQLKGWRDYRNGSGIGGDDAHENWINSLIIIDRYFRRSDRVFLFSSHCFFLSYHILPTYNFICEVRSSYKFIICCVFFRFILEISVFFYFSIVMINWFVCFKFNCIRFLEFLIIIPVEHQNFWREVQKKNKHHTIKPPRIINSLLFKFQILPKIIEILVVLAKEKRILFFLCRLHICRFASDLIPKHRKYDSKLLPVFIFLTLIHHYTHRFE